MLPVGAPSQEKIDRLAQEELQLPVTSRSLLAFVGCIYREKKSELKQGIASFTKLPLTFESGDQSHDSFIFVCADGALTNTGVHPIAQKYMQLIGATWRGDKGGDDAQVDFWEDDKKITRTWFGGLKSGYLRSKHPKDFNLTRFFLQSNNAGIPIVLLLKNTEQCVRQRKIWSHVLAFLLLRQANVLYKSLGLMIDGDTAFEPYHVEALYKHLISRKNLAALSARIAPSSSGNMLLVAAQKVEYALAHYFDKVAELFLGGSALCAPGCFTLMRFAALIHKYPLAQTDDGKEPPDMPAERTVLWQYGRLPRDMLGALKSLQGEDRYLSTLLITQHWKIDCLTSVVVTTACPAGWRSYVTQRRRWLPSTLANQFSLITEYKQGSLFGWRKWLIVPHIVLQLAGALLSLPLVALLYSSACAVAIGKIGFAIALIPPILFALCCWIFWCDPQDSGKQRTASGDIQLTCFQWLSTFYIAISVLILALLIWQIAASAVINVWSPEAIFFGMMLITYLLALLLHRDIGNMCRLPAFFLLVPVMYLLQPIYIIANMHNYSWGTREHRAVANNGVVADDVEDEENFWVLFKRGWRRILCLAKPRKEPRPGVAPAPSKVELAPAIVIVPPPTEHIAQPQESPADSRAMLARRTSGIPSMLQVSEDRRPLKRTVDWIVDAATTPLHKQRDQWASAMRRLAKPSESVFNAEAEGLTQSLLLAQRSLIRWVVCVTLATVMFIVSFSAIGATGPTTRVNNDGTTNAPKGDTAWTKIPDRAGPIALNPSHLPSYALMVVWLLSLWITTICMLFERAAHIVRRIFCCVKY